MVPRIELTKAILLPLPPTHDVFYRPFESNLNGETLNQIMESTGGGRNLSSASMVDVASTILAPASTPRDRVIITNGLENWRYAFYLEITTTTPLGNEREIISGYTDYEGVSANGHIDPNMRFYVNSRITVRGTKTVGHRGQIINNRIEQSNAVLTEIPQYQEAVALRPEDAVRYKQTELVRSNDIPVYITDSMLMGIAKTANTDHNVPAQYLSDISKAYVRSLNPFSNDQGYSDDVYDGYETVVEHVRAKSMNTSFLFNSLSSNNPTTSYTFTFEELNRCWPRDAGFWTVLRPDKTRVLSIMDNNEHWGGATAETNIAFSLTHIMPAIMSRYMLAKMVVSITNETIGGQLQIQVMSYHEMFDETMDEVSMHGLIGRLELDVVRGLLAQKAYSFSVLLSMDLTTNSHFVISINGNHQIPYSAPMFCHNRYNPMIGLTADSIVNISHDIESLANSFVSGIATPGMHTGFRGSNPFNIQPIQPNTVTTPALNNPFTTQQPQQPFTQTPIAKNPFSIG